MRWPIVWIFWCYFYCENQYFGWNYLPHSDAEMIADGIGLLILALAFVKVSK